MTARETNGLKRYLVTVAATVTTALIVQTGVLLFWCGQITSRVQTLEQTAVRLESRLHELTKR